MRKILYWIYYLCLTTFIIAAIWLFLSVFILYRQSDHYVKSQLKQITQLSMMLIQKNNLYPKAAVDYQIRSILMDTPNIRTIAIISTHHGILYQATTQILKNNNPLYWNNLFVLKYRYRITDDIEVYALYSALRADQWYTVFRWPALVLVVFLCFELLVLMYFALFEQGGLTTPKKIKIKPKNLSLFLKNLDQVWDDHSFFVPPFDQYQ